MSRSRTTSAALAVLVLLGVLTGVAPAHAAPRPTGPLRILVTGDSISQGFHGDYSWRYRLWGEFKRQGIAVDFVGSRTAPYVVPGFTSAGYLDPNFDRSHFAQGGTLLQQQAGRIGQEVRTPGRS